MGLYDMLVVGHDSVNTHLSKGGFLNTVTWVLKVQMKRTCGEIQQSTIITFPFAKGEPLFSPLSFCCQFEAVCLLVNVLICCLFGGAYKKILCYYFLIILKIESILRLHTTLSFIFIYNPWGKMA